MKSPKAQLLPYHALNEFMRPDFRVSVIRSALGAAPNLPERLSKPLDNLTKKHVRVPGFRNSDKAPLAVKAGPLAKAFEKHPDLVAAILAAWAEAHPVLRQQVFDLLKGRNWFLLPLEARREKLPGFFIEWPEKETFEVLTQEFQTAYPEAADNDDDISLMIVWISSRLPSQLIDDTPENVTKLVDLDLEALLHGDEAEQAAPGEAP